MIWGQENMAWLNLACANLLGLSNRLANICDFVHDCDHVVGVHTLVVNLVMVEAFYHPNQIIRCRLGPGLQEGILVMTETLHHITQIWHMLEVAESHEPVVLSSNLNLNMNIPNLFITQVERPLLLELCMVIILKTILLLVPCEDYLMDLVSGAADHAPVAVGDGVALHGGGGRHVPLWLL